MFSSRTVNGVHNAGNSNALRCAEEEFGSLKRQLERRERMRQGLPAPIKEGGEAPTAVSQHTAFVADTTAFHSVGSNRTAADAAGCDGGGEGTLPNTVPRGANGAIERECITTVPLFASDQATLEVVRTSHAKHNRVVLAHEVQWNKGKRVVDEMAVTHDAARKDLEAVINASKQTQSGDPPSVDSATATSNYMPIREAMRCIASMGNQIDDADQSPSDFSFLLSDATLSTRERVLLQRLRDVSSRYKTATAAVATLKEQLQQDEMDHEARLHDLREEQRDAMQQAQETWQEEQAALVSDVEHWRESSNGLQSTLEATKVQHEKDRDAARQLLEETLATHRDEVAKWMQAVALGDREKHTLSQQVKELERTLDGSSGATKALAAELDEYRQRYESLATTHSQLTSSMRDTEELLKTTTGSLQILQAQQPELRSTEVQVDTDAIVAEMRGLVEALKKDNSRLRVEGDLQQKRLTTYKAEASSAEVVKKQLNAIQLDFTTSQSALADVTRRQRRDHDRRMALVCENFVLRASIMVLQRPNGFGERMETLLAENRWLMDRLERRAPLRIMTGASTGARLVARHDDDAPSGTERDVVRHVAEVGTQASLGLVSTSSASQPVGVWQCRATQVDQDMLQRDMLEVDGADRLVSMVHYAATSVAKQQLDARVGMSRTIALAATRFRRSMHEAHPSRCVDDYGIDDTASDDDGADAAPRGCESVRGGAGIGGSPLGESIADLEHDVHRVRAVVQQQRNASSRSANLRGGRRPLSAASNASMHSATSSSVGGSNNNSHRPPRPQSALSASSTDAQEAMGDPLAEPSSPPVPQLGEVFCVVGHRDAPQRSALTGNPSHYYAMMREQGLGGVSGKRKEYDLQQHLAMASDVTVAPLGVAATAAGEVRKAEWTPTHYVPASTFPVRTMGSDGGAPAGPQAQRAQSASVCRTHRPSPVTTLDGFMPASRGPIGSWRPK